MKIARETYGFKNVWSQDGKILYILLILTLDISANDSEYILINLYNANTKKRASQCI